ncbi:MAG: hypothetical protein R3E79_26070 [Caldilineaceae bacterium]
MLREVFFRLATGDQRRPDWQNGREDNGVAPDARPRGANRRRGRTGPDIRIGYFSQFSELQDDLSLQQVLTGLFAGIEQIAQELRTIEEALSTTPPGLETERRLARYADLIEQMNREDGWTYQHRIDTVLTQLGFRPADRVSAPTASAAGATGQRWRRSCWKRPMCCCWMSRPTFSMWRASPGWKSG